VEEIPLSLPPSAPCSPFVVAVFARSFVPGRSALHGSRCSLGANFCSKKYLPLFASPVQLGRLPWSRDQVWRAYQKAGIKAGIGGLGTHSLRHTFRAWLDSVGTSVAVQQKLMRHASIVTTMDHYGDVIPILRGSELRCLLPQLQRVKHLAGDVKSAPRPGGLHFVNFLLNNAPLYTEQAAEPVFDNETVLQIVNLPSGYEAWTLNSEGDFLMVGRNGCS
jgi:hypothetical protein